MRHPDSFDKHLGVLIDRRRAAAAQVAGLDIEIALAVGDRCTAQRHLREMTAQVEARRAARAVAHEVVK